MKKFRLLSFIFLTFFYLPCLAVDFLFVLHNLGETNALLPVIKKLPKDSYQILAFGKASETLKDNPHRISTEEFPELATLDPRVSLDPSMISHIKAKVGLPRIIIVGMASIAQAQILNAFDKGVKKVIFYDNFDPIWSPTTGPKEYILPFYKTLNEGTYHLFVPGTSYEPTSRKLEKFSSASMYPLGQPSLESWEEVYAKTDLVKLKSELSVPSANRILLFAGGFDPVDETQYKEDLASFLKGATALDNVSILVTFHPKTDGSVERDLVSSLGGGKCQLIEKDRYSTTELSTIADVVVCFKSTVGAQAAYMGKSVLYIAQRYENFLIDSGIAALATDPDSITKSLSLLDSSETKPSFSGTLGIPKDASSLIAKKLTELLG